MIHKKDDIINVVNLALEAEGYSPETYAVLHGLTDALAEVLSDKVREQSQIEKIRNERPINRVDNLKSKITPAIIININTLRDCSIWQLVGGHKDLEYYENVFKEVVGFGWANSHQYFSNINGVLFQFHLSQTGITVWSTGNRTLFKAEFPDIFKNGDKKYNRDDYDAKIPTDVFNAMREAVDNFVAGKIRCSKCETKILIHEIAGTFYAGQYCSTCWEGGVKQQEANEKYD